MILQNVMMVMIIIIELFGSNRKDGAYIFVGSPTAIVDSNRKQKP